MQEFEGEIGSWSFECSDCGRLTDVTSTTKTNAVSSMRSNGWQIDGAGAVCPTCATVAALLDTESSPPEGGLPEPFARKEGVATA